MIEVSSCLQQLLLVKDSYVAKTKGNVSCARLYKCNELLIEVATIAALEEDRI